MAITLLVNDSICTSTWDNTGVRLPVAQLTVEMRSTGLFLHSIGNNGPIPLSVHGENNP